MLFLVLLLAGFAATLLVRPGARMRAADRWRLALALGMAVAGASHLAMPLPFIQHLPEWVPAREPLVYATGVAEIAFGAALLSRRRAAAGRLLALYLLAVWPANVYVAVAGIDVQGQPDGVYPWVRLALQPLFVWLALWSTREQARQPAARRAPGAALAP